MLNLSGIPVLETQPTMSWIFESIGWFFFQKSKKVQELEKRENTEKAIFTGGKQGVDPCSD